MMRVFSLIGAVLSMVIATVTYADGLRLGMVAKSKSDPNFVEAWKACAAQAEADGNVCDLLGSDNAANAHLQRSAIESALASGNYAALAISVTNSAFIAPALTQTAIPVLTFDSPFAEREQYLSKGYVGPDNYKFGHDLAVLASASHSSGGTLCIITIEFDPNLSSRVHAVRETLADTALPQGQMLTGENGWAEHERCPRLSLADTSKSLRQLAGILSDIRPDVIISVGHWPVVDPIAYRRTVNRFTDRLVTGKTQMFVGVGRVNEQSRALLQAGLVHGLVSIDFDGIGKATYERLKEAATGADIPANTLTKNRILTATSDSGEEAFGED